MRGREVFWFNLRTSARIGARRILGTWTPMIVMAMAQILLICNVSTLQVSIEAIASSFEAPATAIGTAIVAYAMVLAAFILLGGRVAARFGARRLFRWMVLLFGGAMMLAAVSPGIVIMILAQITAGAAAAALLPTLVVLVVDNYSGRQREQALGKLGAAFSLGIVLAFLVAGSLATWGHWRVTFVLLAALAAATYWLSNRLSPIARLSKVSVDWVGATLVAAGIVLISVGSNNLTNWGLLIARVGAPFSLFSMSPAPFMIVGGLALLRAFVVWSFRVRRVGGQPLVALEVVGTSKERAAMLALFLTSGLASAITFLVPLYIQVIQGRTGLETAVAVIPFSLASLTAALLVVRLYRRMSPSRIARYAFLTVACGIALLGGVIHNEWSDLMVIISMALCGIGDGALMTLMFNVLVTASPKELASDVGALRGVSANLATAIGTAVASTLLVSMLATSVHNHLLKDTSLPSELKSEVNLDRISFVSNAHLRGTLAGTSATPEQVDEAVRINTEARLQALKVTFFVLAGIALLAQFPARRLPDDLPDDALHEEPPTEAAAQPWATKVRR